MPASKLYYYCPFHKCKDGFIANGTANYSAKSNCTMLYTNVDYNSKGNVRILKKGRQPLSVVEDDATLIINAHGDDEKNVLSAKARGKYNLLHIITQNRKWKDITASDLADQLRRDGLPLTHCKIKLLSCWSGGPGINDTTRTAPAGGPMAQVLAKELGNRKYNQIEVCGYRGVVVLLGDSNERPKVYATDDEIDGAVPVYAHENSKAHTVWYNSNGQLLNGTGRK